MAYEKYEKLGEYPKQIDKYENDKNKNDKQDKSTDKL